MSTPPRDLQADVARDPGDGIAAGESPRRPTVRLPTSESTTSPAIFSADEDVSASGLRPQQPTHLGRYELLFEMGSGGMATLYLAHIGGPQNFEKLVAIKKIHDHLTGRQDFVDMFLDEARISARIQHPNVVQLYDLGEADGAYFIAMEYVHGRNLAGLLRAVSGQGSRTYGWPQAAWLVSEAAAGLHAAHELKTLDGQLLNLVHRDVSPQNILVSFDGNVKVADFGIAFAAERITHTESGVLKGKIPYMSPQQAAGEPIDRRADVFALGTLLYESVCLCRLFKEPTEAASLSRVGRADVPRPRSVKPDLPEPLEEILLKALARDPADRYQTAAELRNALRQLLTDFRITVDAPQIAEVMHELFDEQMQELDRQITEATQCIAARPVDLPRARAEVSNPPAAMGEVPSAGVISEVQVRSRRWPTFMVIAAVFLATTLAVVVWKWPAPRPGSAAAAGSGHGNATVDPLPGPAPAPAPGPATRGVAVSSAPPLGKPLLVRFEVRTRRASATIHFRKKAYRQNRLQLLVKPAAQAETVRVVAPGYRPIERTILVTAGAQLKHEFRLKRKRRSRSGSGRGAMRPMSEPAPMPPRVVRPRPRPRMGPMIPMPAMLSLE
jgi:eukaryotic-like serine/threonine-protein kinase